MIVLNYCESKEATIHILITTYNILKCNSGLHKLDFEIQCEKCGNTICLDEELLDSDDEIVCPVCGEVIELEFEECDCDCCDCE